MPKYAIYPEGQGTITTPSEDPNYLAANLLNNIRNKVWKAVASTQTATLTIPISAGSASLGVLALFNTNAVSGEITITDDVTTDKVLNAVAWTIDQPRYWQAFTPTGNALTAELELTTTETTLEGGIIRAGDLLEMKGPAPGISEIPKDFSIVKEFNNGNLYVKILNLVRTFSYSCLMHRETEYRNLMTLYDNYRRNPFAMLLLDNISGAEDIWSVFGFLDGEPSATHSAPDYSNVSIRIQEAV